MLGFEDEVWFSRFATPHVQTWTARGPLRLETRCASNNDKEPQALACYGLLRADTGEMMLRFVQGRPVSRVTIAFLRWLSDRLGAQGKKVLVLVWDNARWHTSGEVRRWIKAHNKKVKKAAKRHKAPAKRACRILLCPLPTRSPWLNNIEPKWKHGKRNLLQNDRTLSFQEIKHRLSRYYKCPLLKPIKQ